MVGTWSGGSLTRGEVEREGHKLPPLMRPGFDSPMGRKDLAWSLIDKKLLAQEAKKRGYEQNDEIKRQVAELQERLSIQAMMADEERTSAPLTEQDERAWYDAHKAELAEPERAHLGRILCRFPAGATSKQRAEAKARAEKAAKAIRQVGLAKAAPLGDGPEKDRGGDLGWLLRGELHDPAEETAGFALEPGGSSAPIEGRDGFAVLTLLEKRAARIPSFEEARATVQAKIEPLRKRRTFDQLREKLRRDSQVKLEEAALK